MDYLAKRNLIKPETRANLLGNRLVLIAPVNSGGKLTIAPNFPLAQGARQRPARDRRPE
jgi:molybdate transport system substrate-binding protein